MVESIEPRHGQKGEFVIYDRIDGNVHSRCTSYARWCGRCGEWVHGKGIVSMVLSAIGCPKCNTTWDAKVEHGATISAAEHDRVDGTLAGDGGTPTAECPF